MQETRTTTGANDWWTEVSCSWGLALILCGQQTAWAVRGYVELGQSFVFPAAPVVLGTLMMVRSQWLFNPELEISPILIAIPLLLILLPSAVLSLVDPPLLADQIGYLFALCVLVLVIAFNKNKSFDNLPIATMIIGSVGCLIAVTEFVMAPLQVMARLGLSGNENPLATAGTGAVTACAALVSLSVLRNRWWAGAFTAIAFSLGVSNVLLSITRSTILALIACAVIHTLFLRNWIAMDPVAKVSREWERPLGFFGMLIAIIVVAALFTKSILNPQLVDSMLDFGAHQLLAVLNIADKNAGQDASLSLHYYLMQYNWEHLDIWGHGMMAQSRQHGAGVYAHMGYLQSIYDFGIIGGLLFLVTAGVLPLALIILRIATGSITGTQALVTLLFILSQFDRIAHGGPYDWTQWAAAILVYVLFFPRSELDMRSPQVSV